MWQQVIVGVIVVAALAHFCSKYLPAALRRRIVHALSQRGFDQARLARVFNTTSSCGDGCGNCDSNKSAKAAAPGDASKPAKRVINLRVQR
ncbi:DUF6587 family protein [Duganella aceris]|uniref:Uncharacterized protein n=1 Tax=Duganella aceris TaxID=2703883 RepID=A0ABX0FQR1_9BURK|nr:DUF6587 family protein [Duganella aceris]NGZ86982.1 hypothetical protein [Duganella aceris]